MNGRFECSCAAFTRDSFAAYCTEPAYVGVFPLPIDTFIRLASSLEEETKPTARSLYDRGVRFFRLPFFRLREISSGVFRVCKHDGRHRAHVLRDEGYETMPVILFRSSNESENQTWPEVIQAQEDAEDPEFRVSLPHALIPPSGLILDPGPPIW
jgi:hypothetical protein